MRYEQEDDIVFTSVDGKAVTLKDNREVFPEDYELMTTVKTSAGDKLDEIASRNDIYGEGSEDLSYKIFEMNVVKLVESGFDMSKITELQIPV